MNSFGSATLETSQDNNEISVNVIVKQKADGRTVAMVPGFPGLEVEASDRTTALTQLQQHLEAHLAGAEIVSLAVKLPSTEQKNPWLAMAGVFEDDPQFDQMLEGIENYRQDLDKYTQNTFLQQ